MKKSLKTALTTLALMLGMVFLFTCLMTLSSLIPRSALYKNIKSSASQVAEYKFASETITQIYDQYKMDYYTDSVMLNEAYFTDPAHPLKAAIAGHTYGGGIDDLNEIANHPSISPNGSYSRYWHGYLLTLRPMLLVLDYIDIGVFNTFLFGFLLLLVVFFLYKKIGAWIAVAFLFTVISLNIIVLPVNLQLTTVFLLAFLFMLAVMWLNDRKPAWINHAFLLFGMCTMFFDFYTYPILTFGFPMITLILMNESSASAQKRPIRQVLVCFALWALGYFFTWVAKICLTSIVLGPSEAGLAGASLLARISRSVPQDVYEKVANGFAAMAPGVPIARLPLWLIALGLVALPLMQPVFLSLFAIFVLTCIWLLIRRRKPGKRASTTLALLLTALLPVIWYVVAVNPTIIHFYFQYRGIGVTILGVLAAMMVNIDFRKKDKVMEQN